MLWPADAVTSAKAALEIFAKEPLTFALKPVVKKVLQSIAVDKATTAQVEHNCSHGALQSAHVYH